MADMNMMPISVDKFQSLIKEELLDGDYGPMIGIGKSGVGKTVSIYELTQELGIGFCELRLVTMTEIDLLGLPEVKEQEGTRVTTYAANSLLPFVERDGEEGILVLDEITSATNTIRAAAYQLLDSKRALGEYKLPPKWKVIALGNGIDDGGVFQGMEAAFLSRGTGYRVEPNLDTWKKWAISHGVNPSVIAYLSFAPDKLHEFNPDEMASLFPCPRSWTQLSKKLNTREERKGGMLDIDDVEIYAAGAVGVEVAASFAAFYKFNKKTVSAEDILSGKATVDQFRNMDTEVIFITIQSIIKQLNAELEKGSSGYAVFTKEVTDRAVNVCKWALSLASIKTDYTLTILSDLISGSKLFGQLVLLSDIQNPNPACHFDKLCPELLQFAEEHGINFAKFKE